MAQYPYIPEGCEFLFVGQDNPFMAEAREYARLHSLDNALKTGAVVVRNGVILGRGANGTDYHEKFPCERVVRNIPTGQGYELCEGCHPKNHAEARSIAEAQLNGHDTVGTDLYLWGHWWACHACWAAILDAGVANVYLLEESDRFFDKNHPENILGRWFE